MRITQTLDDIRAQGRRKRAALLDQIEDEQTPHDGHDDSTDVMNTNTAEPIDDNDVMVATFGELTLTHRK